MIFSNNPFFLERRKIFLEINKNIFKINQKNLWQILLWVEWENKSLMEVIVWESVIKINWPKIIYLYWIQSIRLISHIHIIHPILAYFGFCFRSYLYDTISRYNSIKCSSISLELHLQCAFLFHSLLPLPYCLELSLQFYSSCIRLRFAHNALSEKAWNISRYFLNKSPTNSNRPVKIWCNIINSMRLNALELL